MILFFDFLDHHSYLIFYSSFLALQFTCVFRIVFLDDNLVSYCLDTMFLGDYLIFILLNLSSFHFVGICLTLQLCNLT